MSISAVETVVGGASLKGIDAVPGLREGLGVWKQYEVDCDNQPISNITTGNNGSMHGYWWTDHPVVASVDTEPFMCHIWIEVIIGSDTTIDGTLQLLPPLLVDATDVDIAADARPGTSPFFWAVVIHNGDLVSFDIAMFNHNIGGLMGQGSVGWWDADTPVVWADGHSFIISGSFRAKFVSDD